MGINRAALAKERARILYWKFNVPPIQESFSLGTSRINRLFPIEWLLVPLPCSILYRSSLKQNMADPCRITADPACSDQEGRAELTSKQQGPFMMSKKGP